MSIFGRAIAYVVLAVALLAAAVTLNDRKYPVRNATKPELSAAKSDLDAELARCKAIGLEAADAACKAAWEAGRNRFFRSARVNPDGSQRSPTTQNSPDRLGDTTGRLK